MDNSSPSGPVILSTGSYKWLESSMLPLVIGFTVATTRPLWPHACLEWADKRIVTPKRRSKAALLAGSVAKVSPEDTKEAEREKAVSQAADVAFDGSPEWQPLNLRRSSQR